MAIAAALIQAENPDVFHDPKALERWHFHLLRHLDVGAGTWRQNSVTFLTFNYDRSLEYGLIRAMKARTGRTSLEVQEMLQVTPIIHLYGSLGELVFEESDSGRVYGSSVDERALTVAANGISVADSGVDDSPAFHERRYWNQSHRCLRGKTTTPAKALTGVITFHAVPHVYREVDKLP